MGSGFWDGEVVVGNIFPLLRRPFYFLWTLWLGDTIIETTITILPLARQWCLHLRHQNREGKNLVLDDIICLQDLLNLKSTIVYNIQIYNIKISLLLNLFEIEICYMPVRTSLLKDYFISVLHDLSFGQLQGYVICMPSNLIYFIYLLLDYPSYELFDRVFGFIQRPLVTSYCLKNSSDSATQHLWFLCFSYLM